MSAKLTRFRSRQDRASTVVLDVLRQQVVDSGLSPDVIRSLLQPIDRHTPAKPERTFVQLSPQQFNEVVEHLFANSRRSKLAVRTWSKLFLHLQYDTQEIVATRSELAAEVGTTPNVITRIMAELESFGAITRRQENRRVIYYMNPTVGTMLAGQERAKALAAAPILGGVSCAEPCEPCGAPRQPSPRKPKTQFLIVK